MLNQRRHILVAILCVFALVQQSSDAFSLAPSQRVECTKNTVCALNKNFMNFFVIGDTGGIAMDIGENFGNFITATQAQERTANAMAKVAGKHGLDLVINVGDNVYWAGVDNVYDPRFEKVFEDVYDKDQLLKPWYLIAGNHDHLGNISAQIAYTNHSSRWTFPDLFYKAQYAFDNYRRTVDFIFIDTIVLCDHPVPVDGRGVLSWVNAQKLAPDPKYTKHAEEKWKWVEETLKNSRADYLFVVGHYPIHSISGHGPVKCVADRLDPLLRKYQVTSYFSGHDHSIQFFKSDNPGSPNPMYYVVSGAGSRSEYFESFDEKESKSLVYHWPRLSDLSFWTKYKKYTSEYGKGWGGFSRIHLGPDQATIQFYVKDAKMEYQEILKPRSRKIFD